MVRESTLSRAPCHREEPSRTEVWKMFDRVAHRYDLLNRLLSGGIDRSWRKRMASLLPERKGLRILDLATGTADQIVFLLESTDRVAAAIGMDLSEKMLQIGRKKVEKQGLDGIVALQIGDAVMIPSKNDRFDGVTISFGIRNVMDVTACLKEIRRVLNPEGRVLILEFSLPRGPFFRRIYLLYLRYVLPRLGAWISSDRCAYRYLNKTIETFPQGEAFRRLMQEAGFVRVAAHPLTGGIATIYQGDKPRA